MEAMVFICEEERAMYHTGTSGDVCIKLTLQLREVRIHCRGVSCLLNSSICSKPDMENATLE